jgi:hypothetical protein
MRLRTPFAGVMPHIRLTILSLLALSLLCGCTDHTKEFGPNFNAERVRRGIPIIPASWRIESFGTYFDCYDSAPAETKPRHESKRVVLGRDGTILSEGDAYYSGKTFTDPIGGTLSESIHMTYNYARPTGGDPWKIIASFGPGDYSHTISLEWADQVLRSWGLSRTNE